jgi:hypothetical protein
VAERQGAAAPVGEDDGPSLDRWPEGAAVGEEDEVADGLDVGDDGVEDVEGVADGVGSALGVGVLLGFGACVGLGSDGAGVSGCAVGLGVGSNASSRRADARIGRASAAVTSPAACAARVLSTRSCSARRAAA